MEKNLQPFKWVDYKEWQYLKSWYKSPAQIARERLIKYMKDNPGVMAQLTWCKEHPGEAPVLTEEMINEFIETLRFKEDNGRSN